MRITESQLRQIVREELASKKKINEAVDPLAVVAGLATAATSAHIAYDLFLDFLQNNKKLSADQLTMAFEKTFNIPAKRVLRERSGEVAIL